MSIMDDVRAEVRTGQRQCMACGWLDAQTPEDREEWIEALAQYPSPAVHRAMQRHGYPGRSGDAIRNHQARHGRQA